QKLLVAPINMKERFLEMIEREVANAEAGKPSGIIAKVNSLDDQMINRALVRASQAGVPVDLIVRGYCTLRPGIPGLTSNRRVISVIGRFLEHSRMFYFRNGAEDPLDGLFFIGSADWMYRNLHNRVEITVPVEERPLKERCWEIFQTMLADDRQVWEMHNDRTDRQRPPSSEASPGTHGYLMSVAKQRALLAGGA